MKKIDMVLYIMLASAASCGWATQVQAQEPATQSGISETGVGLSDIIVTARRREEKLQSVPISATAFSPTMLTERNISTTQDLLGQVPSVVVGGSGQQRSSENITIRGQGATFNASPGVVLYSAEVPIIADQRNNAQNGGGLNYYDLGSLQVLRGPQGTLFGRNTTGGAVLFEPQRPTDNFEGYGQVQYGNYDSVELQGALNVPVVTDKLLVRVAGIYQHRDGFTHDLTSGKDLDNRNRYSLRLGVTWKPADGIENYLLATMSRGNENGSSTVLNAVPAGTDPQSGIPYSTYLAQQIARGIRTVALSPINFEERTRYWSVTDILSADLADGITFRNIANYQRLKHNSPFDADAIPDDPWQRRAAGLPDIGSPEIDTVNVPSRTGYAYSTDARQYSIEPQLQGKSFGEGLTWVVGGYYENVKPLGPQIQQAITQPGTGYPNQLFSHSKALYAQGTLSFGTFSESLNALRLTAGYRYTWDWVKAISAFNLPNTLPTTTVNTFHAPNWTLGLDYDVYQNVLLYGKVSRGYKAGGVGRANPDPTTRAFAPENVTTYEAGIKADWHIGGMPIRTNIDYYYTKYKNIQRAGGTSILYTDPLGNTSTVFGAKTTNAGRAHIQGVEFEGEIRPTNWFTLSGNYSYMNAKYDKYNFLSLFPGGIPAFGLPPGFDCGAGVPFDAATGNCVLDNIPFQFAPKNQYSVTGRFELPVDESIGKISLSATYSFVSAQYSSPTKAPAGEPFAWLGGDCPRVTTGQYTGSVRCGAGDGYGLLNLNLRWQNVGGSNFDLGAFATNVTKVNYVISNQGTSYQGGFGSYVYGEPRMYGVSLRYRFGS